MRHENCPENITAIRNSSLVTGCSVCLETLKANPDAAKGKREWQKVTYRKDLVQPWDRQNFIRTYPEQSKRYFNEETIRKHS